MKLRIKLTENQLKGASFLVTRNAGFILFATGTGKTLVQVLAGFKLLMDKRVDKFIIVCTKSSMIEIQTDMHEKTDMAPMSLSDHHHVESFMQGNHTVGLMQYEWIERMTVGGVIKGKCTADREKVNKLWKLLKMRRLGISFDECHKLKTPDSYLRRAYGFFRPCFEYVYGATATAIMRNLFDVYNLVEFFQPGILGTVEEFTHRYVEMEMQRIRVMGGRQRMIPIVRGYKNLEELQGRLAGVMLSYYPEYDIRFNKAIGKLENWGLYETAARGFFKETGEESYEEKRHSSRLVDLQYVVNVDPGKEKLFLRELQPKIGEGVIVFCAFYKSMDVCRAILERYKIDYREITGKLNKSEDRKENKDWFNEDCRNKVMLITMAGGQSLNLQSTNQLMFFDVPFGSGFFTQVMGRVAREFSVHKVFHITFLTMEGTVDEYKYELLSANKEMYMKILKNMMIPDSNTMDNFNREVIDRLKKDFLWAAHRKKRVRA